MEGQITNRRQEDTGAGSGRQRQSRPLRAGAAVVLGLADRARCLALIGSSCLVPPAVSAAGPGFLRDGRARARGALECGAMVLQSFHPRSTAVL